MKSRARAESVWRPGSRMSRMRASHNYGAVLLLIVGSFIFIAAAPGETWAVSVLVLLQMATLLLATWTSGLGQDKRPAIPLAALGAAGALLIYLIGTRGSEGAGAVANALLAMATIAVVGVGIVDQREVNVKSLTGALCVYLLLGMFFNFVYDAVAAFEGSAFFSNGSDGTPFERLYFSYVTLATLGYGDYTAGTTVGRSLAVAEVLVGQLFLVTAVALLVGLLVSGRRGPPGNSE